MYIQIHAITSLLYICTKNIEFFIFDKPKLKIIERVDEYSKYILNMI